MTPRSLPTHLAPLVEQLELERPRIVTLDQLAAMMQTLHMTGAPALAAHRLQQRGWLLPTGVRGAYEFAPADRAGPISDADALTRIRAVLAENAGVRLAAALGTALALQNIIDRSPDIPELAVPKDQNIPRPLRGTHFRVLHFDWSLSTPHVQGIPVHRPATVLVHLAHRPTQVRSWSAMLEALPQLVAISTTNEIIEELLGRPQATRARLAYLTQGVAPALARTLGISPAGKVWFGPRRKLRRHDSAWNVADTVLPFGPRELSPIPDATASRP